MNCRTTNGGCSATHTYLTEYESIQPGKDTNRVLPSLLLVSLVAISRVVRWLSPGQGIRARLTITRGRRPCGTEGWRVVRVQSTECVRTCTLYSV